MLGIEGELVEEFLLVGAYVGFDVRGDLEKTPTKIENKITRANNILREPILKYHSLDMRSFVLGDSPEVQCEQKCFVLYKM